MEQTTVGVTVRELGRHAAALLDELERTRRGIVISRYGRAVAYLGPLPDDYQPGSFDRIHVLPKTHAMASLVPEDQIEVDDSISEDDLEDLTDNARSALAVLATADDGWEPWTGEDVLTINTGCIGLQLHGLAERYAGSRWALTPKGKRAAEMLKLAS